MLIVVAYDVNTETAQGKRRLRQVAKICTNYGLRVQNSVFECIVDWSQYAHLQAQLEQAIHKETDSLRYYNLGNRYEGNVKHVGAKKALNVEQPIIL